MSLDKSQHAEIKAGKTENLPLPYSSLLLLLSKRNSFLLKPY